MKQRQQCICSQTLLRKFRSECYDGDTDIHCNCCDRIFKSDQFFVYHCPDEYKCDLHSNGYDLCFSCFSKGIEVDFDPNPKLYLWHQLQAQQQLIAIAGGPRELSVISVCGSATHN